MALFQLIYVSSAVTELDDATLDEILDSSVSHNTPQDVTGMLLYSKGGFMQVLEGEEAAVDETFARICADPRHHLIILLSKYAQNEREFSNWSMGFRRLSNTDEATHPGFAPFFSNGFDASKLLLHPSVALDLLKNFRNG